MNLLLQRIIPLVLIVPVSGPLLSSVRRQLRSTSDQLLRLATPAHKILPFQSASEAHDTICQETLSPFLKAEGLPPLHQEDTHTGSTKFAQQLQKIITREKAYAPTHYVLYHACRSDIALLQSVYRLIFEWEQQKTYKNFIPLRFWHTALSTTPPALAHGQSLGLSPQNHMINGELARPSFIATNFALYGNYIFKNHGECTIDYWRSNKSIIPQEATKQLAADAFDFYGFNKQNLKKLQIPAQGDLLQIFIPKKLFNQLVYLAQAHGIPHALSQRMSPCEFLQALMRGEIDPEVLQILQGRLVIARDLMLNPESGVQIFREQLVTTAQENRQDMLVETCMQETFKEWEQQRAQQILPSAVIERIQTTPIYKSIQREPLQHA